MTRRRWIADQVSGDRAILLGSNAQHLARVLRARVGQEFEISSGDTVRLGRIVHVADDRVEFQLADHIAAPSVPQHQVRSIILLLAIFKFDRFEWAVEKATELGVSRIVPVIAQRTDAHLAKAANKRLDRWRRIAHESAQQSRRVAPPEISEPEPLTSAFGCAADLRIVLAETERNQTLLDLLRGIHASIALAIGPEGGWTSKELSAFAAAGWASATVGPTILRAETAAVAALAICSAFHHGKTS